MTIITVPHQTLRQVAKPVTAIDKKLLNFIKELGSTLKNKDNPRGVGLAAPQVDVSWRVFATQLPASEDAPDNAPTSVRTFLNPVITKHSSNHIFGPNEDEARLEGCLSIPKLYGAVPRFQWVELEFQVLENETIVEKKERFENFFARVVQHELDHLDGILFTDYSLEFDLPLYQEDPKTGKLTELSSREKSIIETF